MNRVLEISCTTMWMSVTLLNCILKNNYHDKCYVMYILPQLSNKKDLKKNVPVTSLSVSKKYQIWPCAPDSLWHHTCCLWTDNSRKLDCWPQLVHLSCIYFQPECSPSQASSPSHSQGFGPPATLEKGFDLISVGHIYPTGVTEKHQFLSLITKFARCK